WASGGFVFVVVGCFLCCGVLGWGLGGFGWVGWWGLCFLWWVGSGCGVGFCGVVVVVVVVVVGVVGVVLFVLVVLVVVVVVVVGVGWEGFVWGCVVVWFVGGVVGIEVWGWCVFLWRGFVRCGGWGLLCLWSW
ncbi:hypothetical protein RA281_27570, partial [Pseudomonas syringae pv. tagetis]